MDIETLSKAEKKALKSKDLLISQINDEGEIKTSMLLDLKDPRYANYYLNTIASLAHIMTVDGKVEILFKVTGETKKPILTRLTLE